MTSKRKLIKLNKKFNNKIEYKIEYKIKLLHIRFCLSFKILRYLQIYINFIAIKQETVTKNSFKLT